MSKMMPHPKMLERGVGDEAWTTAISGGTCYNRGWARVWGALGKKILKSHWCFCHGPTTAHVTWGLCGSEGWRGGHFRQKGGEEEERVQRPVGDADHSRRGSRYHELRWCECQISRHWADQGLISWSRFGFYPVGDNRKLQKDLKTRQIMQKCCFPGWCLTRGNARAGKTHRQPASSPYASHGLCSLWYLCPLLRVLKSPARDTCKNPQIPHTHILLQNVYLLKKNKLKKVFFLRFIWISTNFKVKIKIRKFFRFFFFSKMYGFIHFFNNTVWCTHSVLGSVRRASSLH